MVKVDLTQDVWTEVFTNVKSINFHLINYPDKARARAYKIHHGLTMPADDINNFIYYTMKSANETLVVFNNTTEENIYIMPIYDNGSIIY